MAQFAYEVSRSRKTSLMLHLLKDAGLDTVLVFTRTKRGADKLARKLEQEGVSVATLHSNKSQSQRQVALKGFKSKRYRVLVATDIAARGIDVDGISHVVNYDFPAQPEDYVHRIGRTGRALAIGDALSFVTSEDLGALRALEKFIGRGIPRRPVDAAVHSMPAEESSRSHVSSGPPGGRVPRGSVAGARSGQSRQGSGGGGGGQRSGQSSSRSGGGPRSGQGSSRPGGGSRSGQSQGSSRSGGARQERSSSYRTETRRPTVDSRPEPPEKAPSRWGRLMQRVVGKPIRKR